MTSKSNGGDFGRRVSIRCPCCGGKTVVRRSEQSSALTRQYHLIRCDDPLCGWSGGGIFEITHTLSPPSRRYGDRQRPPDAEGEDLARWAQ